VNQREKDALYEAERVRARALAQQEVEAAGVRTTPTGRQLRDAALLQVDEHADASWKQAALDCVRQLAQTRNTFTTDDVWDALRATPEMTHEPRALGAIMRRAQAAGLIAPTDEWRPSKRPVCHASPKRVWMSLR
jgi:hypothetical protein